MTKRHLRILFIIALMLAAAVALPQITAHACQGGCEITCEDANVQVPLGINDGIIFDLIMQAGQTLQVISVWESGTTQGTVNINIEGSPYDSLTTSPSSSQFTGPSIGLYTIEVYTPSTNDGDVSVTLICGGLGTTGGLAPDNPFYLFKDGRLNRTADQADQTAAVYCKKGTIEVYQIAYPKAKFLFRVSQAELNSFLPPTETPQLIKEKNGVRLYMLDNGELQLNAPALETGKGDYVFGFSGCPAF